MEIEPELPIKHDATPNLKLVMNPEGKMHDWSDLPEEEVPEITQMAMVGNPEIAKTLATNLNDCKGRGKVLDFGTQIGTNNENGTSKGTNNDYKMAAPSFAGSFRQVFDSRRGMFEQSVTGNRPTNKHTNTHNQLARSKTLPDLPKINDNQKTFEEDQKDGSTSLKRPCYQSPPSPLVPKRTSSKQMVAKMSTLDENNSIRRPLRSFFYNA